MGRLLVLTNFATKEPMLSNTPLIKTNSHFLIPKGSPKMERRLARLPPGFRFCPTDEELVVQYLRRKALSCPLPASVIPEIDLGKYDPWDLPGFCGEERYFFHLRETRSRSRAKRAVGSGYWKATGTAKAVVASNRNEAVGTKRVLVFYHGKTHRGSRTGWIMHEYSLHPTPYCKNRSSVQGKEWVVCRIFMKRRAREVAEYCPVRSDRVGYMDTTRLGGDTGEISSCSSCVTDASEDECDAGEADSKQFALSSAYV